MSDNTDNSEITGPTNSSKEPLRYDGNKAKLPGLLAEIWDCCERTGKFRPLSHRERCGPFLQRIHHH